MPEVGLNFDNDSPFNGFRWHRPRQLIYVKKGENQKPFFKEPVHTFVIKVRRCFQAGGKVFRNINLRMFQVFRALIFRMKRSKIK